jgi:hypothetical protein
MVFRTVILALVAVTALTRAQATLELRLPTSPVDLSPYYRAVVREATGKFRGDAVELVSVVTARVHFFTLSTGEVVRIEEAHFDSDPFPATEFSLRRAVPNATPTV